METYGAFVNRAVLALLGGGRKVLDVGCGRGALGAAAARAGNVVTGVDLDEKALEIAAGRLHRALRADVTDVDLVARELAETYDRIVFADILEHVPEPMAVLAAYRRLLAPGGRVIVSLPNVAAWTVRLSLLAGRWDYADSGILDRTHLRFFTRASGRRMIEAAGYDVLRWDLTPATMRPLAWLAGMLGRPTDPDPIAPDPMQTPAASFARKERMKASIARLAPGLLACQFVYEASPVIRPY